MTEMVDASGVDESKAARGRRKIDTAGLEEGVSPVKKRRGRPRKSDTIAAAEARQRQQAQDQQQQQQQQGIGTNGTSSAKNLRKPKMVDPLSPPQVDASLVGQSVHGVLDGSFDAGYILTVRVGQTDTLLRGVVFGPGLCVPITGANDIAPNVKFAGRGAAAAAVQVEPSRAGLVSTRATSQALVAVDPITGASGSPFTISSKDSRSPMLFGIQSHTALEQTPTRLDITQQQHMSSFGCSPLQLANGSQHVRLGEDLRGGAAAGGQQPGPRC